MQKTLASILISGLFATLSGAALAVTDTANGDWTQQQVTLTNTSEAALMARVGDINNFGFGWPSGFDPFSGNSTPAHNYPWTVPSGALPGLDRIMVITSYKGNPPVGADGYTASTSRPANAVQEITLTYDLSGVSVQSAILQMFVDDFQAPVWKASYQATINGKRATFLESVINSLDQTGPIGKLITLQVPSDFLPQVASGKLVFKIDDTTTGAGDGYAIDFVKLLVNPVGVAKTGTVTGKVTDSSGKALANVIVTAGGVTSVKTDSSGIFTLTSVPAGLASITATLSGYETGRVNLDVIAGKSQSTTLTLTTATSSTVCAQVVTAAKNPQTGSCVQFPTPCDVPTSWTVTSSCDVSTPPASECGVATYSSTTGALAIPVVEVPGAFGGRYKVDMKLVPGTAPFRFELTGATPVSSSSTQTK